MTDRNDRQQVRDVQKQLAEMRGRWERAVRALASMGLRVRELEQQRGEPVGWVVKMDSGEWLPEDEAPYPDRSTAIAEARAYDGDWDKPVSVVPLYAGPPEPIEQPQDKRERTQDIAMDRTQFCPACNAAQGMIGPKHTCGMAECNTEQEDKVL